MKEELYYIVPKDALDAICSHLQKTLKIPVNNDCKLINLSDEAIRKLAATNVLGYDEIEGYKQALIDIKQQIK